MDCHLVIYTACLPNTSQPLCAHQAAMYCNGQRCAQAQAWSQGCNAQGQWDAGGVWARHLPKPLHALW